VELDVRAGKTGAGLDETSALVDVAGQRARARLLQHGEVGRAHRGDQRFLIGEIVHRAQHVILQPFPDGKVRNDRNLEGTQAGGRANSREQQQMG
jgi:hypothetical protein